MDNKIKLIKELASKFDKDVVIMEVCGGHTNTILRSGIRDAMPSNIKLISGPGCPVCVTTQKEIDEMIGLAKAGIKIATYADMLRVPGTNGSIEQARSDGADIQAVYSTTEIVDKDRVFFGIGFETTTPMTAKLLEKGITVYSAHKLIPPGLIALGKNPQIKIDALILPGHVSAIIGEEAYLDLGIPQVITGFEEEQVIDSIIEIIKQKIKGESKITNIYSHVVTKKGNKKAQEIINQQFKIIDSEWRGLGVIPKSGLEVRKPELNAKIKYKHILDKIVSKELPGCKCAQVVIGVINPNQCPLFEKICTPKNPRGACMVSEEGACQINYMNR